MCQNASKTHFGIANPTLFGRPCGSAVIRTPSDAAWNSKGATVYYRSAVRNFRDNEGHLKPRDVKMPIAVNSSAWDGTGTLVHNSALRRG